MISTVGAARAEVFSRLRRAGVERADWEARQLMCFGTKLTAEQLILRRGMYLPEDKIERVLELAGRRAGGEPLAYILGGWEIFGLELVITPDVLIPREDTGALIDAAFGAAAGRNAQNARILDLCCGSGCVGIALAKALPCAGVTLADISAAALRVARLNARKNLGSDETLVCVEADALSPPSAHMGRFDVIACNPPYISDCEWDSLDPSVRCFEPPLALRGGPDGLDFYRAVSGMWSAALRPGGALAFEVGCGQAGDVRAIMAGAGFSDIVAFGDSQGHDRVVTGIYRKEEDV